MIKSYNCKLKLQFMTTHIQKLNKSAQIVLQQSSNILLIETLLNIFMFALHVVIIGCDHSFFLYIMIAPFSFRDNKSQIDPIDETLVGSPRYWNDYTYTDSARLVFNKKNVDLVNRAFQEIM